MALFLQDNDVPAALADEFHRLVATVFLESAAPGGVASVVDAIAGAFGSQLDELGKVVYVGVAVAYEKYAFVFALS